MTMMKSLARILATTALLSAGSAAMSADIAVIGGSNDDAFWNLIKKGLDDARPAVEANGGSVNYLRLVNYDNFAPDVVQLIRTAISMEVDGLVIPNWVPESEDPAIKDAMAAGIKVILMNAGGGDKAKELGALNYVGSDEYLAGVAGGEYFSGKGAKNVLCVNTIPGAANLEARCQGVADGIAKAGGKSTQLPLPSTSFGNATAISEAIKAELLKDESIDGIINIGAADARDTLNRICDLAEAEGVVFTLENLNPLDHPGCPFGSTADVLALVSSVNRPQLRINLDLYHTQIGEGDLIRWCEACLPWIGEVQVADNPGRYEPGTGEINYAGVAKALAAMGYHGAVGLESFAKGSEDAALEAFRNAFTV